MSTYWHWSPEFQKSGPSPASCSLGTNHFVFPGVQLHTVPVQVEPSSRRFYSLYIYIRHIERVELSAHVIVSPVTCISRRQNLFYSTVYMYGSCISTFARVTRRNMSEWLWKLSIPANDEAEQRIDFMHRKFTVAVKVRAANYWWMSPCVCVCVCVCFKCVQCLKF